MTKIDDKNFDDLSSRFQKNIYSTAKGKIRLSILWRDLIEIIPGIENGGLSVLDAGAGQGNFALQLAQKNHHLTLCDVSKNMLSDAEELFTENKLAADVGFIHTPVQNLSEHIDTQYDIVLFHAVLEWLAEPEETLRELLKYVKPGGYLSLMFYSRTGLIFQNLTRGNFDYIKNNSLSGNGKTLTPINPLLPEDVYMWLSNFGLDTKVKSGVRTFYDGISRERRKQIDEDELIELEKHYSRIKPYNELARYIHVISRKP